MKIISEIQQRKNGAKFVKADLHIHSYKEGGSFDVEDINMTPQNIVDKAIEKGLKIISITDHNVTRNSEVAVKYAEGKDILVIPGIEISTTQGHLLIYCDTIHNLNNIVGKLTINEEKTVCTNSIKSCLDIASQFNGIGVLAHIELSSGFEKAIGRFGPQMDEVFIHPNLFALEISNKSSVDWYTMNDGSEKGGDRKRLVNLRKEHLQLKDNFELPKVMSSDSHTLDKLGVNADGNRKLTRIKVDTLSFKSFKVALLSSSSRIRIEELIPEAFPKFVGIKFIGGLLHNQTIKLSDNLTCIIGGRGAGKSTFLESIRETSGNKSKEGLVDCDIWSDQIYLIFEDETGRQDIFLREKNETTRNISTIEGGITKVPIESYGQGETADTIQHSDKNPKTLIEFLDSFIEIEDLQFQDKELQEKLLLNEDEIEKLTLEVKNIPDIYGLLKNAERKLEVYKTQRVGEIVKYQDSLLKERALRGDLNRELKSLVTAYGKILSDKGFFEDFNKFDDSKILIGKENFKRVKQLVIEFTQLVDTTSDGLKEELNKKVIAINDQLKKWGENEKNIQDRINKKRKELEEQGIPFDMGRITKVSKNVIEYKSQLESLRKKERLLKERIKERRALNTSRQITRSKIFQTRNSFAVLLNRNLKDSISDFFVNVKYDEGGYSPLMEDFIKNLMEYRTAKVPKAKILARYISPLRLSRAVERNQYNILTDIKDKEGNSYISVDEAKRILFKLKERNNYYHLENIDFEDRPTITVTKTIKDESGNSKHISKSLSKLSLGQQQSILLAILLQSKSKNPLIIDQPEDNLDSEFIYKTIVKNLKKIKEQRQVIIVTHNANIAVLGDAELIIPLKSTSDKSMVMKHGAIDNDDTKILACEILEGGEDAFVTRKNIYGI